MIQIKHLNKAYNLGEENGCEVLKGISLHIKSGELVAIMGASGAGKSTLLHILAFIDKYDNGQYYFDGQLIDKMSDGKMAKIRNEKIGIVMQDFALIEDFTSMQNVLIPLDFSKKKRREKEKRKEAREALKAVQMEEYATKPVKNLSGGQKQRVAIARAIVNKPQVLLADEPTGNLDQENSIEIIRILKRLSARKLVIMVTHDLGQVKEYATRQIILHDGEVISDVALGEEKPSDGILVDSIPPVEKGKNHQCSFREIYFFATKNVRMQRGRSLFLLVIMTAVALASFLFIGQIAAYSDDHIARTFDDTIFSKNEDDRLLVRRTDGELLKTEDLQTIRNSRYIRSADLYGYANEIYYTSDGKESFGNTDSLPCVASATVLSDGDLLEGKLPENRYEVAVTEAVGKKLKEQVKYSFQFRRNWGRDEIYSQKFRVTGIVKGKEEQTYFSSGLCEMLTIPWKDERFSLKYAYSEEKEDYLGTVSILPVVAEDLSGNQVRIAAEFDLPVDIVLELGAQPELIFKGQGVLQVAGQEDIVVSFAKNFDKDSGTFMGVSYHGNSQCFMELSEDLYRKIYGDTMAGGSVEVSAYLTEYKKTDKAVRSLEKKGYGAVSTYRVSTAEYDQQKVYERLRVLGISGGVLVLVFGMQMFILSTFLKVKGKGYQLVHSLGMDLGSIKKIVFFEMLILGVTALLIGGCGGLIMGKAGVSGYTQAIQVYSLPWVVLFLLYNLLCAAASALAFVRSRALGGK